MSSQTDGSRLNGSDSDNLQMSGAVQPPARMSRLSRRTMASDMESFPASDTEDVSLQAPAAGSGRGTRPSTRSSAGTDQPPVSLDATDGLQTAYDPLTAEAVQSNAGDESVDPDAALEAEEEPQPELPPIQPEVPTQVLFARQGDRPIVPAPSDAVGDALAAYNILRAFSWQIRLSPSAFEELCAALFMPNPSPLMDELHVCLIRSLAFDENKAERGQRGLDLSTLDAVSWPEFVWEYLHMQQDDLRHHRWTLRSQSQSLANSPQPVEHSKSKVGDLQPDDEAAFKENLSDRGTKTSIAVSGRSPCKPRRALGNRAGPSQPCLPNGLQQHEDSEGAVMLRQMMQRKPFQRKLLLEYYALPPGVKAAILVSLVNDMLDISSVRHEIDKREAAGQWVAGKGGAGGSFPMRSDEERAQRAEAGSDAEGDADYEEEEDEEGQSKPPKVVFEGDGNTDLCVLCGLGGSLLCCDGCPAAYHMRCIGETAKSIPDGEWLCPECCVGGRGETAGLRVPRVGLNQHKQPLWMCHGCLFRSARPELNDIGGEAREEGPAPMDRWQGEVAAVEAKGVRKIKGEERPHPSSFQALREPPEVLVLPGLSAEMYVNRYRNSWTAAVAATKTFVDDMARKRGRPPKDGPRPISIPAADLPVPVPLSRFQWPSSAGKGQRGNLVRCGQCHMCRNPLMKKPCLHPIVPRGFEGSDEGTSAPKLVTLANYAMKVERDVWGALDGPWGSDTWMAWRRVWAQKVRTATTAEPVAAAILELISRLRPRALSPSWALQLQPRFTRALQRNSPPLRQQPPVPISAGRKSPAVRQKPGPKPKALVKAPSRGPGRPSRQSSAAADGLSTGKRRSYKEDSDSGLSESDEEEAQDPFADDLDDPTIVDSTGHLNRAGWALNQRNRWESHPKLPHELAKQLGRRGGTVRVTGVKYNTKQLVVQARLAWKAALQEVSTASQLALQLRKLDGNIQWEAMKRPLGEDFPYASAEILDRRPAAEQKGWEYLLQSPHGEGIPNGRPQSAQQSLRQPLQPLIGQLQQALGQAQEPQAQSKAGLESNGEHAVDSAEANQHPAAQQGQQTAASQMSVLPNDATAQQHQPAVASDADKQITVQQAITLASLRGLPDQPQHAAAQPRDGQPEQGGMPETYQQASQPSCPAQVQQAAGKDRQAASGKQAGAVASSGAAQEGPKHAQHTPHIHDPSAPLNGSVQYDSPLPIAPPQGGCPAPHPTAVNGMPKQASLLAALIPSMHQRPVSAGTAPSTAPGQFAAALPQSHGPSPALSSREATPAVRGPPAWVHEDALPLWLVKAYEEKRRRDVSMVAARAAQQAQREANAANRAFAASSSSYTPTLTLKTKRQEAKAAAEAAAAAAADACAVCGLLYGDDAEKDDLWVACDRCNKWYHGVCVDQTQEKAEALEEGKWECPDCSSQRNEKRRIALERAKNRRATQGRAVVSLTGSEAGSEDVSGSSKKDSKKGRRPAAAGKKQSRKRKAVEEAGPSNGQEEEAQTAEPQEIYCLCRQPDDPTRDFIECSDCAQWFHPECVGTTVEEAEASDKYTCPLCTRALHKTERKRQRQAEAAAAAELEQEAREAQAARKAKLAELDMSDWPRNWQAAMQRVLESVLQLPEAFPFAEPVPLDETPGYRELIPHPMDLSTVLGRAKADHYDTPLEAVSDVRQVWANCRMYNAEGSQIWQVCADAESAFDLAWGSARLPLPPAPPLPPKSAPANKRQRQAKQEAEAKGPSVKIKLNVKTARQQAEPKEEEQSEESGSDAEISEDDEPQRGAKGKKRTRPQPRAQADPAAQLKLAQKVVKGLTKMPSAAPFSAPVDEEEVPGYSAVVPEPMDLGTVLQKLKNGAYTTLGAVLRDVDLVWANCRAFNEPDSDICAMADEAQQALRIRWQQAGLPTVTPADPSHPCSMKKSKGKKRALDQTLPSGLDQLEEEGPQSGQKKNSGLDQLEEEGPQSGQKKKKKQKTQIEAEPSSAEELKRALKAVKALLKLKVAALFAAPVSEEDVPGYHSVVSEPMDLQTVADKLQQQAYVSLGQVWRDVDLVWTNCRTFNEPDSDICAVAEEAEKAFKSKWQQQDLPDQAAVQGKKKNQGKQAKVKQEAGAVTDDTGSGKKQKKDEGSRAATAVEPSSKGKASRPSGSNRQTKGHASAADTDGGKDPQPSSATAATSRSPNKGKQKSSKVGSAQPENASPQPSSKKQRLSIGSEAAPVVKQKKGAAAASQQETALNKAGGKKLTASERLRQGLPPTPSLRASSRLSETQPSPEAQHQSQSEAGPSRAGKPDDTYSSDGNDDDDDAGGKSEEDELEPEQELVDSVDKKSGGKASRRNNNGKAAKGPVPRSSVEADRDNGRGKSRTRRSGSGS